MPKLTIDSAQSLYAPVEVEIDGQVFTLRKLTREMLLEFDQLGEEVLKGNLEAGWKRLEVLFGPSEIFSKLDVYQVGKIITFVIRSVLVPEPEQKNGLGPGQEKSPE